MATVAIPGQLLASTSTHLAGPGTHVHETNIFASILGATVTIPASSTTTKPTISIPRPPVLPTLTSTILCRITRVQQRQATASILPSSPDTYSYTTTSNPDQHFSAILRREDVRAYEKDKVVMNDMFRVGDIVRACVISLGDERNYYISTAGNEYGVVVAVSEAGNAMVPVSWREMRDVVSGRGEARKVAKPVEG